jgi:hypothetical protein
MSFIEYHHEDHLKTMCILAQPEPEGKKGDDALYI